MSMMGLKSLGKKKYPPVECKPCPKQFQGIPEGGPLPDIIKPSFVIDPLTGQRMIRFRGVNAPVTSSGVNDTTAFYQRECVYIETKYYWVKHIKTGDMCMASERIERQDGKLISSWMVKDGANCTSNTGCSKEGILAHYEIIEEICPPTTQW
jgi:hypothetical protein